MFSGHKKFCNLEKDFLSAMEHASELLSASSLA